MSHNPNTLIVLSEKHGEYRFAAPTPEDLHRVCIMIVKGRYESENWYFYDDEDEVQKPAISKEDLNKMPDGAIKRAGLKEWDDYARDQRRIMAEKQEKDMLAKALAGDGPAALRFLRLRDGGEYEGFEITELNTEYYG